MAHVYLCSKRARPAHVLQNLGGTEGGKPKRRGRQRQRETERDRERKEGRKEGRKQAGRQAGRQAVSSVPGGSHSLKRSPPLDCQAEI